MNRHGHAGGPSDRPGEAGDGHDAHEHAEGRDARPHDDEAHEHPEAHDPRHGAVGRALVVSLVLNGAFFFVELGTGWWTGSLALLSDAAHMLSDVGALALALLAARFATRPPTAGATYGFVRAEVLGALVNAVALVVACLFLFKEAIERLVDEVPPVPGWPILVVGALGLLVNLGSAWMLWRSDRHNLNVRAALAHMMADALGSLGAIMAAILVLMFGWSAADPVVSMFVCLLVLWSTRAILMDSIRVLMDFAPPGLDQGVVDAALRSVPGVADVHDLHVRALRSGQTAVTAHVTTLPGAPTFVVLRAAEAVLRDRLHVHHSTLQFDEPEAATDCPQRDCTLRAEPPRHAHAGHSH